MKQLSIQEYLKNNEVEYNGYTLEYDEEERTMLIENDSIKLESVFSFENELFHDSWAFMEMFNISDLRKLLEIIDWCIKYHKECN